MTEKAHQNAPNTDPPFIRYSGPWTDAEKERVQEAVHHVETNHRLPTVPYEAGVAWIAFKHQTHPPPGITVYAVSRLRMNTTTTATSVEELCSKIRQMVFRHP